MVNQVSNLRGILVVPREQSQLQGYISNSKRTGSLLNQTRSYETNLLPQPPAGRPMESIVKKFQRRYKKIRDEMCRWEEIQSCLVKQFSNASAIIERIPVIQGPRNYGILKCIEGIDRSVLAKQMESLQNILISIDRTMEEFHAIVVYLEKAVRDSRQLVKEATTEQRKQRVGGKPTIVQCLDGLQFLEEIHRSEYKIKLSIIAELPPLVLNKRCDEIGMLQQLLVDQPNIVQEEVKLLELNTSNDAMHIGSQRKRPLCIITRVRPRTYDPPDLNLVENILVELLFNIIFAEDISA